MSKTQSELQAELDSIEAKLTAGAKSVTTDGTKIDFDLDALRLRANELRQQITALKSRRPVISSIYLGHG